MLEIEVLLTENQLTEDFLSALKQRYLPEKFFYWFPLSVKAWLDLCQSAQPYKNFSRSYQLVSRHASEIADRCLSARTELVALGAGQGDKDLLVLQALHGRGKSLRYRPIDSSQALLEMAVQRAGEAGFQARGLKADLEDAETAGFLAASADEPRLYLLLGNSLGIIDPVRFLTTLREVLRREDLLLIDGEIYSPEATLQGYDNPINRRFAFAPLASVGLEEGRDGDLIFQSQSDARLEGLHMIAKYFRPGRHLKMCLAGQAVELEAGEKVTMNSSWKYSSAAFRKLVRRSGGFEPLGEYASEDERFLMMLAAPGV